MLIEEAFQRGSGDRLRGMPSDLPILQSTQFGRQSFSYEDFDGL
jgi:hypothetical protein